MSTYPELLKNAKENIQKAQAEALANDLESAKKHYITGLGYFELILKNKAYSIYVEMLRSSIEAYTLEAESVSERIKENKRCIELEYNGGGSNARSSSSKGSSQMDNTDTKELENDEFYESEEDTRLMRQIMQTKVKVLTKWDDIIGLGNTKKLLSETIFLPIQMPHLFTGNRVVPKTFLFYGPPGTGKTQLAKAVASLTGFSFFEVSSADIISKYVGDSERTVKLLFRVLEKAKPVVLFIDEVDALCSKRNEGNGGGSGNSTKTIQQFLIQLSALSGNDEGFLFLAATNLPWVIDTGMQRRFNRKIYVPLPDEETRELMIRSYMSRDEHCISDEGFRELGRLTEYYSGSDIKNFTHEACMEPVRLIPYATHFEKVLINSDDYYYIPTTKCNDKGSILSYVDIADKTKIRSPKITIEHAKKALKTVKSSIDVKTLIQYEEWTKAFGSQ